MSEAVALALIAMFHSWGDLMWQNLAAIIPAIGSALVAYMTWRNNVKSERRAQALRDEVDKVRKVASISSEQAELMAKGAERRGVEIGMQTERLRTSDLQALRAGFRPESTDAYMDRTDPEKP